MGPTGASRQLLVDVSALARTDAGTGIQRVVKQLLAQWEAAPPEGWRVEPVYSPRRGQPWRYVRGKAPMEPRAGDHFLGLDLHPTLIADNEPLLARLRELGVTITFTLYDLLPVRMPASFPPGTDAIFDRWLHTVARVSDGVVAISRSTADDFTAWLAEHPGARERPLDIGFFALGAELPRESAGRVGWFAARKLGRATSRPAFLMVGTLEPRKGHSQALDAMEQLWQRGVDVNLVIAGKAGWLTDSLVRRLRSHPERNRRLFWFGHASDALLARLYGESTALLAASEGEGFGLPLVEAAQHRLPVIARDLPVFREVAGDDAWYFSARAPAELASAIEQWLALHAHGAHPRPDGLAWHTWQESARSLEEVVLGGRWFRRWCPPA